MPKIRGIKPETWTDENFVELSPLARLLFIGLWNYACDNGHVEHKPKQIKMRVLPADDCNCSELLRELANRGRIVIDDQWITIPTLTEHQRIDKRWFVSCEKPECAKPEIKKGDSQREPRGGHDEATTRARRGLDVASWRPRADVDVDVDGELMVSGKAPASAAPKKEPKKRTPVPAAFKPNDKHRDKAKTLNLDVDVEVEKFCDYHLAKGTKNLSWDAAFNNWLRMADEFRTKNTPSPTTSSHLRSVEDIEEPPPFLSPDEYEAWRREKPGRR